MSVPQDKSAPRRALASRWLFCVLCVSLIAARLPQTLYMPRTYRRALRDGTRSSDGRPGSKYWENHARYRISVTASPPNRTIHGTEQVSYTNNSPDTLRTLVFKLFMNVHRPGAPRGTGASQAYLTTGEHVDSLAVNGKAAEWPSDPSYFTSVPVTLPSPLAPRDSVRLDISWHYDLVPAGGSREGVVDSTTYFVAYFYPRVAAFGQAPTTVGFLRDLQRRVRTRSRLVLEQLVLPHLLRRLRSAQCDAHERLICCGHRQRGWIGSALRSAARVQRWLDAVRP